MRPSLALCLIIKNEAHNIGPLLQSVRGCFDEIHLTDTGSTDATLEFIDKINEHIDKQNPEWSGLPPIKVHHFEWINDFAAARNYSFSHATTDYIFWMDGDDVLSDNKAFIKWRDNIMHSAHYWCAVYNYAYDDQGRVECQFIRERVIKNNFGFAWKYFVHEGLVQVEGKQFWPNKVTTWTIDHRRTAEDRKADHMRNIKLFEAKDYDSLESRMKYYYGKELVENGMPEKAGKPLMEALKDTKLELHDRILAYQYAAQSAMHAGSFPEVIALCFDCLKIMPTRAEVWCLLGDCYKTMGQPHLAKTAYRYALTCEPNALGGVIVTYAHAYSEYPHQVLAALALAEGNFPEAEQHIEALKSINFHGVKELEAQYYKVKDLATIRSDLPKVEDIIIACPPVGAVTDWDENTLLAKGHGGSETAAIEVAKELHHKTKRPVKIFHPRLRREKMPSGVEYIPSSELQGYLANVEPKACINWRHSVRLTKAPSYVWCHDLVCPGGEKTSEYESIFALSEFHRNYLHEIQGIPLEKIRLLFNGINPSDFEVGECEKNPLKVVFSSSPDRGLDRSILIVEKAREVSGLDLELHCFYGFENMKNGGLRDMAERMENMIAARPWVKYHGPVNKKTLMKHFKEASVWLYPANFIETYCITAIEALVAGVYPIVRDMGALKYTMREAIAKDMCDVLEVDAETPAQIGIWANRLVEAVLEKKWTKVSVDAQDYTWGKVADAFISELHLEGAS